MTLTKRDANIAAFEQAVKDFAEEHLAKAKDIHSREGDCAVVAYQKGKADAAWIILDLMAHHGVNTLLGQEDSDAVEPESNREGADR